MISQSVCANAVRYFNRTGRFLDHAVSIASPFLVFALLGVLVAWTFQREPHEELRTNAQMNVQTGGILDLSRFMSFTVPSKRAVLRVWLENEAGSRVYQFPDQTLRDSHKIGSNQLMLDLPADLPRGQYVVHVEALYPFNPLRNGRITVVAGTLIVSQTEPRVRS